MFRDAVDLFASIAEEVAHQLSDVRDWGLSGNRDGQYAADLVADRIVLERLTKAGLSVLSEESGLSIRRGGDLVIVDPLDGSTNASRGVPWYATALCLLDEEGPVAALVRNQVDGTTFTAERGGGAFRNGVRIRPTRCEAMSTAIVGLSGMPPQHFGWSQFRALGAAALDLCLVASGVLDAYMDCSVDAHGVWDYAAGVLICQEAGAVVADARGRALVVPDPTARRTPLAAATKPLLDEVQRARQSFA